MPLITLLVWDELQQYNSVQESGLTTGIPMMGLGEMGVQEWWYEGFIQPFSFAVLGWESRGTGVNLQRQNCRSLLKHFDLKSMIPQRVKFTKANLDQ